MIRQSFKNLIRRKPLTVLVCVIFPLILCSQSILEDSLFWQLDTILDQQIDTLGKEKVLSQLRTSLSNAIQFCTDEDVKISSDSATAWIDDARWAVILDDDHSLQLVEDLTDCLRMGDRGNWKYHTTYMLMWGSYEGKTRDYSQRQKIDLIFSGIFDKDRFVSTFYEDRMVDLGSMGIPGVLDWVSYSLVPRMNELDKEMLSEEDYQFTKEYNRFTMVFSNMIFTESDRKLIEKFGQSTNPNKHRFATDVLTMVEIEN